MAVRAPVDASSPLASHPLMVTVQAGENMASLSSRCGVSEADLALWNGGDLVFPGEKLRLSAPGPSGRSTSGGSGGFLLTPLDTPVKSTPLGKAEARSPGPATEKRRDSRDWHISDSGHLSPRPPPCHPAAASSSSGAIQGGEDPEVTENLHHGLSFLERRQYDEADLAFRHALAKSGGDSQLAKRSLAMSKKRRRVEAESFYQVLSPPSLSLCLPCS
jgi:hypothetical protein